MIYLVSVLHIIFTDKAKRFLAEFYIDGDGGKLFKYGEQLVSRKRTSDFSFDYFSSVRKYSCVTETPKGTSDIFSHVLLSIEFAVRVGFNS